MCHWHHHHRHRDHHGSFRFLLWLLFVKNCGCCSCVSLFHSFYCCFPIIHMIILLLILVVIRIPAMLFNVLSLSSFQLPAVSAMLQLHIIIIITIRYFCFLKLYTSRLLPLLLFISVHFGCFQNSCCIYNVAITHNHHYHHNSCDLLFLFSL